MKKTLKRIVIGGAICFVGIVSFFTKNSIVTEKGSYYMEVTEVPSEKEFVSAINNAKKVDYTTITQTSTDKSLPSKQLIKRADSNPYEKKQLIVKSKKIKDTYADNCIAEIGDYFVLEFSTEKEAAKAMLKLESTKNTSVDYAKKASILDDGSESYEYLSYGPKQIKSDSFVKQILQEKGGVEQLPEIVVAVVDSGINYNHPFLKDRVIASDYDFIEDENDGTMDKDGHGSHVAGIIVDSTPDNVKVKAYQVADSTGNGTDVSIAQGILQAIEDDVDVINISMGGQGSSDIVTEALDAAMEADIVVVVGAGNDSQDAANYFPASYPNALTISATDSDELYSYYSNYGSSIDFCAPGTDINSSTLEENYEIMSGTSMATPFVSAAAALLHCYDEDITVTQVKSTLKDSAKDLGDAGFDEYYGHGQVCLENIEVSDMLDTPTVNKKGGEYDDAITLQLSSEHAIYYTLDGTYPTKTNGIRYSDPITLTSSALLQAVCVDEDGIFSDSDALYEKYYIDGGCLEEDFEITEDGTITAYSGSQTKLILPQKINNIPVLKLSCLLNSSVEELVIPDGIRTLTFASCSSVKKVHIGKDVDLIEDECFDSTLEEMTLSEENKYFKLVDDVLLSTDGSHLFFYPSWKKNSYYAIPETVEVVSFYAFNSADDSLKELYIPASVQTVEIMVDVVSTCGLFWYNNFEKITVSEDNKYYSSDNYGALYDKEKTRLIHYPRAAKPTAYIMPDTVKILEPQACLNANITDIQLSENLQILKYGSLCLQSSVEFTCTLKELTIPRSVYYIGAGALDNPFLENIYFEGDLLVKDYHSDTTNILQISANILSPEAENLTVHHYSEATGFDEYNWPSEVEIKELTTGSYKDVRIMYPVTEDFSLLFNTETKTIESYEGSIDTLTIPEQINGIDVQHIGFEAFAFSSLKNVTLPDNIQTLGEASFFKCSVLETVTLSNALKIIEHDTFNSCTSLSEVTFGKGLLEIDSQAFMNNTSLLEINLPDTVQRIGRIAFLDNSSATTIHLPDALELIGSSAFSNCQKLILPRDVLPDKLEYVYKNAFINVEFEKLILPSSIKRMEAEAFLHSQDENDSGTPVIYCEGNLPFIGYNCFPENTVLYHAKNASFLTGKDQLSSYERIEVDTMTPRVIIWDNENGILQDTQKLPGDSFDVEIPLSETTNTCETVVYVDEKITNESSITIDNMVNNVSIDIFYLLPPKLQSCTPNSIILKEEEFAEYSLDGETWQSENEFYNLESKEYSFYIRYKKGEIVTPASEALVLDLSNAANQTPTVITYTDSAVLLESYSGYEYSLDETTWQDSALFENLNAGETYTFYQRNESSNDYSNGVSVTLLDGAVSFEATYGDTLSQYISLLPEGYYFKDSIDSIFQEPGQHTVPIYFGYDASTDSFLLHWYVTITVKNPPVSNTPDTNNTKPESTIPGTPETDTKPNTKPNTTPESTVPNTENTVYTIKKLKYRKLGTNKVQVEGTVNKKIKKIVIPKTVVIQGKSYKVVSIKSGAFNNLKKVKQVTIGENVKTIDKQAFYKCKNLKKIFIKSKKIKVIKKNAFSKVHKKAVIYVPKTKKKAYSKLAGIKLSKCKVVAK